jgi:hypothetical protein
MDKKEVVDALSREAKIEPSVTQHGSALTLYAKSFI